MRKDIGCAGSMIKSVDHFQQSPFSFSSFRYTLLHNRFLLLNFITYQLPITAWGWRQISTTTLAVFQGSSWQKFHKSMCVSVSSSHYKLRHWNSQNYYSLQNRDFLSERSLSMVSVWSGPMSPLGKAGGAYPVCYRLCITPPTSTVSLILFVFPIHTMSLLPESVFPFSAFQLCPFLPLLHALLSLLHFGKRLLPTLQSCVYMVHHKQTWAGFTNTPS